MENFKRFAVYYAPPAGAFADHAAAWLGKAAPFALPQSLKRDWQTLTQAPRKYGFHGTLRAPFRPRDGLTQAGIAAQIAKLATRLAPVQMPALEMTDLHGFLALTPRDPEPLDALAAEIVKATNPLRAELTEPEIARRKPELLTPRQRALLDDWGYPFVMEEFRFHLTLTDQLYPTEIAPLSEALQDYFAPVLPQPFVVDDLCLFGEDAAGRFHLLHRYRLRG